MSRGFLPFKHYLKKQLVEDYPIETLSKQQWVEDFSHWNTDDVSYMA